MARLEIKLGMRVVHTDSTWKREGTVVQLANRFAGPPDYAKIRFDSIWLWDAWVPTDWLAVVDSLDQGAE